MLWMTFAPPVQIFLSLTAVILCVHRDLDRTSPVLLTLVIAEQVSLFALSGVIIARQLILSQIFQTLPWQERNLMRPLAVRGTVVYLAVCTSVTLLWVFLASIPQALMNFNIVTPQLASATTLVAAVIVAVFYGLVVVCNRLIPLSVFCDYATNIVTFCMMVVLVVASACINNLYYFPNDLWQSNVALRSVLYIVAACMYAVINYIRPVWAVWRHDIIYLRKYEDSVASAPPARLDMASASATSMKMQDMTSASKSPLAQLVESVNLNV